MVDDMNQAARVAETIKAISDWLRSSDGSNKLTEMLCQATQDNEEYRKAGELDPKVLLEPVTL